MTKASGQPSPCPGYHRQEALRQSDDHDDEDDADDQLPDIRQIAGKVSADEVDGDRAEYRTDQRAPPPEGHPDDELGAKNETRDFGGDYHRVTRVAVPGEGGDHGRDHHEQDLQSRRIDAEIGATAFVLTQGYEHAAKIAVDEKPPSDCQNYESRSRDPEPSLDRKIEGFESDETAR